MQPKITIRAQTPEEELTFIGYLLSRMDFYSKYEYTVTLPTNLELIEKFNTLEKKEKLELLSKEYDNEIYERGITFLEKNKDIIESIFPTLEKLSKAWEFKLFPEYSILLTRYGTGGKYNSIEGTITMMVKDNGAFVRSKPYMTPIHEIIHIGVEQIIVKKYKLNQPEKERLVDLMVKILFSKLIPEYEVQSFGEIKIEPFVDTQTIGNLPKAIQQYVNIYPR